MVAINFGLLLTAKGQETWQCSATEDPLVFEKQCIYVGHFEKWNGDKLEYEFDVTEADIDNWIAQHDAMIQAGVNVPVPKLHSFDPDDKRGDVLSYTKKFDSKGRMSLYAKIKFNSLEIAKQNRNNDVSIFSPAFIKHGSQTFVRPIQHVGLTDYPVVGDLEKFTIAASTVDSIGKKANMDYLKKICEVMGLEVPADATEDSLVAMISEAFQAMKDELDAATQGASKEGNKEGSTETKPAVDATIAASIVSLTADNRALKIEKLVNERKITPAQATKMKNDYVAKCSPTDGFEAAYNLALSNEPIKGVEGVARTGSQHRTTEGQQSKLVANAKARAKK